MIFKSCELFGTIIIMNNYIQMFLVCVIIVLWRKISDRNPNSVLGMSCELFYNQLCERGYLREV